jgi:hypothetical protein
MRRTAGLKVRCSGAAVALWLHVWCWLGVDARIMYMSKEVVFGMQISSGPSLRAVIVATDSTSNTRRRALSSFQNIHRESCCRHTARCCGLHAALR